MSTIKEIAKLTGVSPMTVSNVINGKHKKVSAQTIQKVERVMKELDYVPNLSARALVSKNSNIIVLIIPQSLDDDPDKNYAMHNPFYGEFINSIEYNLRQHGYYMMLRFVSEDEVYYPLLKLWHADGVIVLGTDQNQFDLNLSHVDIPIVLVDSYIEQGEHYCSVTNDDRLGGWLAAEHLVARGCHSLAVICTDLSVNGVSKQRFLGFENYLADNQLALDSGNIFEGYPNYHYGIRVASQIVASGIDGVFAFSDMVAFGVMEGLKRLDQRIPQDVSVIGFDNIFISDISQPKLASIDQNIYRKGTTAVELLLRLLEDGNYLEHIVLPVALSKKASVK